MSFLPQTTRQKWGLAVVVLLAIGWYLGIGDHTPSRQDAERFLDWFLDDADGMIGFHDSGKAARITVGVVSRIDDVTCHTDTSRRKWFQRFQPEPNYDCIYRLAGSDGSKYLIVIYAIYQGSDPHDFAQVGKYQIGFLAEDGQRKQLARYDIRLPVPD